MEKEIVRYVWEITVLEKEVYLRFSWQFLHMTRSILFDEEGLQVWEDPSNDQFGMEGEADDYHVYTVVTRDGPFYDVKTTAPLGLKTEPWTREEVLSIADRLEKDYQRIADSAVRSIRDSLPSEVADDIANKFMESVNGSPIYRGLDVFRQCVDGR